LPPTTTPDDVQTVEPTATPFLPAGYSQSCENEDLSIVAVDPPATVSSTSDAVVYRSDWTTDWDGWPADASSPWNWNDGSITYLYATLCPHTAASSDILLAPVSLEPGATYSIETVVRLIE
jgi:hypothetical protein